MILAAGLGTRLRPLTNDRPKALVELNGRTLLEITVARLRTFGVTEIIVNVHHHANLVADYLKAEGNFGLRIEISHEDTLLDTGGGLKKAGWFFLEDGAHIDAPFFLHNVDVISDIDLAAMLRFHGENNALATLAIQRRESSRLLLFDDHLQLRGRQGGTLEAPPIAGSSAFAFSGIHVISPRLLHLLAEEGVFSIIDAYVRLAAVGQCILGFRADSYYWRDLGRPADLTQAAIDSQREGI